MKFLWAAALLVTTPLAGQAAGLVGGGAGPGGLAPASISCAELARAGVTIPAGTTCVNASGQTVPATGATLAGASAPGFRLICPYPYRPSDSVFVNGAGYLTKDQVRRATGCLRGR